MTASKALSNKDMNGLKVTNLGAPANGSNDAVRKVDLETQATADRSRANHTGTQLANTISDFDAQVRTSRLDQMAAPTAPVALNNQKISGLADPGVATDAASKNYVDQQLAGVTSGQVLKGAVRAVSTSHVVINNPGSLIDGLTPNVGDIFLLTAEATPNQNGPWVWNGPATSLTRAPNWDSNAEAVVGSYWVVAEGSKADSFALLTNDTPIVLGTTVPTFSFVSVGGAAIGRFAVDSPAVVAGGTWTVTHNLGSQDVTVQVRRAASPFDYVDVYVTAATLNTVTISPDIAMLSGEYRAVVKY